MAVVPVVMKRRESGGDFAFPQTQVVSSIGALAGLGAILAGIAAGALTRNPAPIIAGVLIGLYLMFALKVAKQWEKTAVLRLGKYRGLRGPGLFHIIPVIDTATRFVDQRVRVTDVTAESGLTRDTVPVNVDAIVFWLVWKMR